MSLEKHKPQKPEETGLPVASRGEAPRGHRSGEAPSMSQETERSGTSGLMQRVVERANLLAALKRVEQNKGSGGVDGREVGELRAYLKAQWLRIREELLAGRYKPMPVKRVQIPKATGEMRELGIPTVLDRFIQQALLQVLQPILDPTFSEHSYGFRPGRSAHQAVLRAQSYVQEGRKVVVDVDLEKFFDRVNHDVLMGRLAKRLEDKAVLRLIRRYLEAGVMLHGVVMERHEGTPQGGPLSPLLSNIMLNELDKELELRGHPFVRYADAAMIFCKSKRAARRVKSSITRFIEGKLFLKVNREKTVVSYVRGVKFLGYSFYVNKGKCLLAVHPKTKTKMKPKLAAKRKSKKKTSKR